jgi:hypothetical protein
MTEVANAIREEKEADHHPYFRPKDAATLILVDRSAAVPKVLVGKRHDKVVFMPENSYFPAAGSTRQTTAFPLSHRFRRRLKSIC